MMPATPSTNSETQRVPQASAATSLLMMARSGRRDRGESASGHATESGNPGGASGEATPRTGCAQPSASAARPSSASLASPRPCGHESKLGWLLAFRDVIVSIRFCELPLRQPLPGLGTTQVCVFDRNRPYRRYVSHHHWFADRGKMRRGWLLAVCSTLVSALVF